MGVDCDRTLDSQSTPIASTLPSKMNFVGTVSRLRTGVNQGWKIKSFSSSKFLTARSNSSQHFRRTLINSTETGGILPKKAPIRMDWNYKLPALATMAGLIAVDLKCFLGRRFLERIFRCRLELGYDCYNYHPTNCMVS